MRGAILVNGVPASGKSSIAAALSTTFNIPLLGLDTVKEALFSELGTGDRLYNRTMGRASYAAIWALTGAFPPDSTVVVDAWFGFQPMQLLQEHLENAQVARVCEIWCHAPPEVVAQRYLDRCGERHEGHLGPEYAPELRRLAERATPMALYPLIEVDTTRTVDIKSLVARVGRALGHGGDLSSDHLSDDGPGTSTRAVYAGS
jgi:glucokinase